MPQQIYYNPTESLGIITQGQERRRKAGLAEREMQYNEGVLKKGLLAEARAAKQAAADERQKMFENAIKVEKDFMVPYKKKMIAETPQELPDEALMALSQQLQVPPDQIPEEAKAEALEAYQQSYLHQGINTAFHMLSQMNLPPEYVSERHDQAVGNSDIKRWKQDPEYQKVWNPEETGEGASDSITYAKGKMDKWIAENPDATEAQKADKESEFMLQYKRSLPDEARQREQYIQGERTSAIRDRIPLEALQAGATAIAAKVQGDNVDLYIAARDAEGKIDKIDNLITHIKTSKAITGLAASYQKNIERFKVLLGSKASEGEVSDTELLEAMMGSDVFAMIKPLGIGARGLDTPEERIFLQRVLTGEISLNKATLLEMAKLRKKYVLKGIQTFNKLVDVGDMDDFFTYSRKQKTKFGGNIVVRTGTADDGTKIIEYADGTRKNVR